MLDLESPRGATIQLLDEDGAVQWARGERWAVTRDLWDRVRERLGRHDSCSMALDEDHWVDAWLLRAPGGCGGTRTLLRRRPRPAWMKPSRLTARQRQIAELASSGATMPEVARHLGLSTHTVRTHLRNIYRALGVSNRLELARSLAFVREAS